MVLPQINKSRRNKKSRIVTDSAHIARRKKMPLT